MKGISFHCLTFICTQQFIISSVRSVGKSISFSDFAHVVKDPTFVDKTLLLREVLECRGSTLVLTAPRGFGKTFNVQMLKAFFQVEVDKNGNKITSMKDPTKPIKDTPNFKLFQQTKIMKNKHVMDKHFGKYPVIEIDLKHVVGFSNFNDTKAFFKEVLHESISEHSYLGNSDKLDADEKDFVRLWSSDEYKSENIRTLTEGLQKLSKYLFKHFDSSKVVFLIDHYDSPLLYSITHPCVTQDAFNYVIDVTQGFFTKPKDDLYVDIFIISGILQIEEPGNSNTNTIERYQFLQHHNLVPFFGFTEDEVYDLLGRYTIEVDKELVESVQNHYGGYEGLEGSRVSNPWAILNYLDRQKFDHVWARRSSIPNLQALLKIPDIHNKLERMLKGVPTKIKLKKSLSAKNLKMLRDIINQVENKTHFSYASLFYSFMFERGFLTFAISNSSTDFDVSRYMIPNEEIKQFLWATLDE